MSLPSHTQTLPSRWRPLKYFCAEPPQYGLNVSSSEYTDHPSGGLRLLRTTDINEDGSLKSENEVYINTEGASSDYRLPAGDLLLSRSGTLGRSFLCTTSLPPSTFAGYLIRFRPRSNVDPRYLNYCSQATFFEDGVKTNAVSSTIANFNAERYGSLQLPWHPLPEQRAIADYLDAETARIDTLISKKRRLIDLLTEKRTALITQTVTRGLDPSPHFRPSGIDWLRDIPTHWEARRLKDVGKLVGGAGFPEALQGVGDEELPFFKVGDLSKAKDGLWLANSKHTISRETATSLRAQVIPKGAIAYAKIGAALLLNRRRIVAQPSCIDNNMSAYIPDASRITTEWALYTLLLIDFGLHVNPGAVPSLSEGDQAFLPIAIPPLVEQRAIADYLDAETARIDALSSREESVIKLLQEYRTALITAAVTGQVAVET